VGVGGEEHGEHHDHHEHRLTGEDVEHPQLHARTPSHGVN
jgi:hypothetical protein